MKLSHYTYLVLCILFLQNTHTAKGGKKKRVTFNKDIFAPKFTDTLSPTQESIELKPNEVPTEGHRSGGALSIGKPYLKNRLSEPEESAIHQFDIDQSRKILNQFFQSSMWKQYFDYCNSLLRNGGQHWSSWERLRDINTIRDTNILEIPEKDILSTFYNIPKIFIYVAKWFPQSDQKTRLAQYFIDNFNLTNPLRSMFEKIKNNEVVEVKSDPEKKLLNPRKYYTDHPQVDDTIKVKAQGTARRMADLTLAIPSKEEDEDEDEPIRQYDQKFKDAERDERILTSDIRPLRKEAENIPWHTSYESVAYQSPNASDWKHRPKKPNATFPEKQLARSLVDKILAAQALRKIEFSEALGDQLAEIALSKKLGDFSTLLDTINSFQPESFDASQIENLRIAFDGELVQQVIDPTITENFSTMFDQLADLSNYYDVD